MNLSKTQLAVLALIGANIIWGATPPIFKWAMEDIAPFTLAFLRFFFSSLIFLPLALRYSLKIERKDLLMLGLLGFSMFLHIAFFFLGLELSTSINAPIIGSAGPIFLMIAGVLFLKEHPGKRKIFGGLMGLIGVLLIILLPVSGFKFDGSVLGNLFFVLSTITSVANVIFLKELSKKYNPIPLVFWTFVITTIFFLPAFANDAIGGSLRHIGPNGIVGIAFGAIFASCVAYFLFYSAIKHLMASEVGIFTYIDPVITILIAIPLLGEKPTPIYAIGALLVFLGIYIAEKRIHYHPVHMLKHKT